ncbi:putative wall-associated receptor kinase-like 16 isoform X1 [Hordeum vulgare subsp. vulgare]|uniref:putative wall-associated receptor kinase-like 16 isoform X1 n=1 Tax=Hordeum vulgare subsp. vulgare TaxID=112509 RepID=UPI001D1A356C|nr:putative wall-associated receptor kinase-like 16 isoform X1 [Hordeum vulgare subsp. vulgare]
MSTAALLLPVLLLLPSLLAATAAAEGRTITVSSTCQSSCGGIDIPYPFGIGTGCYRQGFEINCTDAGGAGPVPLLANTSIPVVSLSTDPPESRVLLPVRWQCYDVNVSDSGKTVPNNDRSMFNHEKNVPSDGIYRISDKHNVLFVLGCATIAIVKTTEGQRLASTSGCLSFCRGDKAAKDSKCAGAGCCKVDIPPELTSIVFQFLDIRRERPKLLKYSPCDYAFIADRESYDFRRSELLHMDKTRTMSARLDWAIREMSTCADAKNMADQYACKSDHSECVDSTNGSGYACNCSEGYEGNPYLVGESGCTSIILGSSFLLVALLSTLLRLQRRRTKGFFKKNGGLVLRDVGTLNIFTKKEINKITKNHSEVLGKGCFGKVYKGILQDGTIVAVKTSIKINKAQKEDFTKEVKIQSQMIHKNIIKLVGCCLEVDVPMLVYEFAANGSLQDILHGKTRLHNFPLDLRLDIAIDAAEGLTYMHSSTCRTIRHGDVKPANILLDEKNMPKISDFGTSKFLTKDKDHTGIVVGSMEYIDPMFCETGQLTQKSDVYNFGVVLLELITRKPTVYDGNHRLIVDFCDVYQKENSGEKMFDKDIATEEDTYILEEIGRLAVTCLAKDVEDRPEMKEVAERLAMLRRARKTGNINKKSPSYF